MTSSGNNNTTSSADVEQEEVEAEEEERCSRSVPATRMAPASAAMSSSAPILRQEHSSPAVPVGTSVITILGNRYDHHGVVFATTVLTGAALVSLLRRHPQPSTPTLGVVVEFQPQQQPQQEDGANPNNWQRRRVEGPPQPNPEVPAMEPVPDLDLVLVPVPERPDDEMHEPENEHCVGLGRQHQLKHDKEKAVPGMTCTRAVVADILHSMVTTIIARTDIDVTILEEDKTPLDDDWLLVTVAKDEEPQDENGGTEVKKKNTIWNVTVGATTSRITEVMATMMATTTMARHGCYYNTYDEAEISDLMLTDDSSSGSSTSCAEDGEMMALASTSRAKQYAQLVFGTPAMDNEIRINHVRANNNTTVEENGWIETILTTTNAATASLPEVRIISYSYDDNSSSAKCIIDDENTATGVSEYTFCCPDVSILQAALSFCLSAPTTSSGPLSPTASFDVHSGRRYDPMTVAAKPTSSATSSETTQPLLALTEEELVSEVSHNNILETAIAMPSARPSSSLSSSTWSSSVSSMVLNITRLSNQYKVTKWYHNAEPYDDRTEGATRHERSEETESETENDNPGPTIRDSIGRSVRRHSRSTSNLHPARETDQYYFTTTTDHEPARSPQQGWMEMVYFLPAVDTDVVCF